VADVIPKMVAERLLQPAVSADPEVALVCREAPLALLLGQLSLHEFDVVLADAPAPENVKVRASSHLLGECGVVFLAAPRPAGAKKSFPRSLDGAPFLLPSPGTGLRHALERWFEAQGVRRELAGEFDDASLLKAFGRRGPGGHRAGGVRRDAGPAGGAHRRGPGALRRHLGGAAPAPPDGGGHGRGRTRPRLPLTPALIRFPNPSRRSSVLI
jgi:LysR family transcriptional activator of nhaA